MATSTPEILARLKTVGVDPHFFRELCEALEDYLCSICGFDDIPGLGIHDRRVLMYCPTCSGVEDEPNPVPFKA